MNRAASEGERRPRHRGRAGRCRLPAGWWLAALVVATACSPGAGKTAYVGATIFDGTGGPPILDGVLIVSEGHVEAVGAPDMVEVPRGAEEVRVDGRWIIPGLIDAHTHAERWTLLRYLAHGITTVREMGGDLAEVMTLRDETLVLATLGPRMYVSGAVVDASPATLPGALAVDSRHDARRAVDTLALLEAYQTKIYTRMDLRLLRPLLDEAEVLRMPIAAHLGRIDALTAARLGIRSLEHMSGVVQAAVADPRPFYRAHDDFYTGWNLEQRSWAGISAGGLRRTAEELAGTGVAIVPTLVYHEAYSRLSDPAYREGLDLSDVPPEVVEGWDISGLIRRARLSGSAFAALRRARSAQDRFVRQFLDAGGLVAAGSNSPRPLLAPGPSLHDELAHLVRAGLSQEEALLAATRDAARLLDTDSLGVLQTGTVADFVVLSASPLDDIANTGQIEMVVSRGTRYRPGELRARW